MVGGALSYATGGKFGHGFVSAAIRYEGNNIAVGAIIRGTVSAATGGKFANGAITGAFAVASRNRSAPKGAHGTTLNAPNNTESDNAEKSDNYAFKYHMHKARYGSALPIEIIRDGTNCNIKISGTISAYKDQGERFIAAIKKFWEGSVTSPSGTRFNVDIDFAVVSPIKAGDINLNVDSTEPAEYGVSPYRANAEQGGSQTNIWIGDSSRSQAHEFGHNIGFADAYKDTYGADGKVNGSYTLTNSGDIMGGSSTGRVQWYHAHVLVRNFSKKE